MTTTSFKVAVLAAALTVAGCGHSGSAGHPTPEAGDPTPALTARWRWVAPHPSYVGMPGADADGVAVTFGHSHVVLLDPSGAVRWIADQLGLRDVAPRLTPDLALVSTEEGVVAYDRASGSQRWAASLGDRGNVAALAANRAVVSTWEGALAGVDLATGKVAWKATLPGPALGPAAAVDGTTVVVSWEADHADGAGVEAYDAATGRKTWSARVPPGGVSGPGVVAVAGGTPVVVVVAGDIAAHGLAADSGVERWRTETEGAGEPEVVPLDAGDGKALVGHRLGGMALLDGTDGQERWRESSDGATVRGGPAGPGPGGRFALPLDDGRVLLAGPGQPTGIVDPPGRVSGVASGPGGDLLVSLRETTDNEVSANSGW